MKGAKLAVARIAGMAVLLVAGVGVSAALADPGNGNGPPASTVPGSPGDDCSHGNSDQDCKPDPSENGKDCDDHGNARGNEDHCAPATTTTTTPSTTTTTPSTTTTTPGTTTTTPGTTTTTPGATTTPGGTTTTPSTPTGNGPTSSGATGSTPPPASPPTAKPVHEAAGKKATKAHAGRVASKTVQRGELPFTGFPAWALALIGCLMLAAGFGLRRVTS
jgi:hypothetical protein